MFNRYMSVCCGSILKVYGATILMNADLVHKIMSTSNDDAFHSIMMISKHNELSSIYALKPLPKRIDFETQ